jgi:hypothetical protein
VAHLHGAPAGLADHRESFGQNFVERCVLCRLDGVGVGDAFEPLSDARAELCGFGAELFIGELLNRGLKCVDGGDSRQQALDGALIRGAEYLGECLIEKHWNLHLQV